MNTDTLTTDNSKWLDLDRPIPKRTAEDREASNAEYLRTAKRKAIEEHFNAGFPQSMRAEETRWDDPKLEANAEQIAKVRAWKVSPKGILAAGPTGRGKTRSVMALWQRLALDDGIDVRYYHAQDWFSTLLSFAKFDRDDARGWVEAVASRPIIIIDDFGQEAVLRQREEWVRSWWFRFLDLRIQKKLPLIITTNLSSDRMVSDNGNIRGDPLVRRLMELCEIIKFQ